MSTAILSTPRLQRGAIHRPSPLLSVVAWEVRRIAAARSTWIIIALVCALSCAGELLFRAAMPITLTYANGTSRTFWIDWGSNYGLFNTLPQAPGIYLGLALPFLAADGVARDLHRRTHELIMTTAIPTRAYVWGRYLTTALLAVALACVMLLAIGAVAAVRHVLQPDRYVVPDLSGIVALWALMVLPPTVLLASMSFALGTLLPRLTTLIKLTIMLTWFVTANITGRIGASCLDCTYGSGAAAQRAAWDPTSLALQNLQSPASLARHLAAETQGLSGAAFIAHVHALEQQLPTMSSWIVPHVAWILIGAVLVVLVTLYFQRFRPVIG